MGQMVLMLNMCNVQNRVLLADDAQTVCLCLLFMSNVIKIIYIHPVHYS